MASLSALTPLMIHWWCSKEFFAETREKILELLQTLQGKAGPGEQRKKNTPPCWFMLLRGPWVMLLDDIIFWLLHELIMCNSSGVFDFRIMRSIEYRRSAWSFGIMNSMNRTGSIVCYPLYPWSLTSQIFSGFFGTGLSLGCGEVRHQRHHQRLGKIGCPSGRLNGTKRDQRRDQHHSNLGGTGWR